MTFTLWLTGISGSGKTTLSNLVYDQIKNDLQVIQLDGDNIRKNLRTDLNFDISDRVEMVRYVGDLSYRLNKIGISTIVSLISPFDIERTSNSRLIDNYIEVFCNCPVEKAKKYDKKGLYTKSVEQKIKNMTAIQQEYEVPRNPDVVVYTYEESELCSLEKIMNYLRSNNFLE